jgi:hypothetical protein
MVVWTLCCWSGLHFGGGKTLPVTIEFSVPVISFDPFQGFIAFGAIDFLGFLAVCH